MIPAAFAYHRPRTLPAALALLQRHGADARLLAGGQSLLPMMKLRLLEPAHLIDIGRIRRLRRIRAAGDGLRLGALATHWMIEASPAVRRGAPVLAEAARAIGDLQVRNVGTLGGSLAHADPAADYPAALLALDARIGLLGPAGARVVPAAEFFHGVMATALEPGEILVEVEVPSTAGVTGGAYLKVPNPASGFALAGAAAVVRLDGRGQCEHVRVGVTGVAAVPYRARDVEEALAGRQPDAARLAEVAARAADGVTPNEDLHASGAYRLHLARVLVRRALAAAVARALAPRRGARRPAGA
jgi:carbon-monoxide dehydrogenase medium subunit